ncbi:pathogenesis-related protein PRB1-2-like [Ananas comosus]|uniref:Pathogenesis-related protein PRB1-2-like n=1 Tax=Ananas comosus TaxID=4615 RepID=A0A6P5GED1_ANACO|nr:pathogenesis-related protein PRB1-2-like [Ananas comosus]
MAIANSLFALCLLVSLQLTYVDARKLGAVSTITQFLAPHNALRGSMGLPPLQWSAQLAAYANWYGNQRRGDCELVHSTSNYGENIFWGQGNQWRIADAVAAWAAEQAYYNYNSNSCDPNADCSHYTQMVWRSTKFVGCARITCNSGDTFIVCEYDPHGNVIGKKPY